MRVVVHATLEPTALERRSPLGAIVGMLLSMAAGGCAPAACSPRPPDVSSSELRPAALPASAPEPPGPIRHVIVVSIDGLMPESYRQPDAHRLEIPTLRRLVAEGASSSGALSVFPSVTYPSHTSMASGVIPGRHGIVSNRDLDLERYETAPSVRGMHGYDPARPEMKASLILYGSSIEHGDLPSARLIDIAPTVASWLGLELAGVDGKPLEVVAGR